MIKKFTQFIVESVSETEAREFIKEHLKDNHQQMLMDISDRFDLDGTDMSHSEKKWFADEIEKMTEYYLSIVKSRSEEEFE